MSSAYDAVQCLESYKKPAYHLRDLFAGEGQRFENFKAEACGILFDFAKQRVSAGDKKKLLELAVNCRLAEWRRALFAAEKINTSEQRAVLHVALRGSVDKDVAVDGLNVSAQVQDTLTKMRSFTASVHSGAFKGFSGRVIDTVVNIGIGGSDLGPKMIVRALAASHKKLECFFVSNVDGHAIDAVLKQVNPETTLFLIASKTFTTVETMMNAAKAKAFVVQHYGDAASIACHFAALSTNAAAVAQFGIAPENMFPFADWVGGRYSLWSAIGLSIALSGGFDVFEELLRGARDMDRHFMEAPYEQNVPVLMALYGIWNRNVLELPLHLIHCYDERLSLFTPHIQQMDMESNGKVVGRSGQRVPYETGPHIYGVCGTDNQHSYMQLVHQGSTVAALDFIGVIKPLHGYADQHQELLANMLAQSRALAFGQTLEEAGGDAARVFEGDRPSTTILLPELNAYTLGALTAAYEHKVFVQGIIWDLNSYDQPGVELGKILAKEITPALKNGGNLAGADDSTRALLNAIMGKA